MAAFGMFTGSRHLSLPDANFHAAGRDMTISMPGPTVTSYNTSSYNPTIIFPTPAAAPERAPSTAASSKKSTSRPGGFTRIFRSKKPSDSDTPIIETPPRTNTSPASQVDAGSGVHETTNGNASSSRFPYRHGGLSVSSAEDIDTSSALASATKPEVYVRCMLPAGKGLACWYPGSSDSSTRQRGVVPGDVGTFGANEGFQRIFNLWEDQDRIRSSNIFGEIYSPPERNIKTHKEHLSVGDAIPMGTSAKTEYTSDGGVEFCEFRMLEPQGAVLALTSSADLEALPNRIELRDFIIENAPSIIQYANSLQKLDAHGDSLYIVTGCIKSDSWAVAAYNGLIDPQNDVLRLVRKGSPKPIPAFGWAAKGTAEARSGSSQNPGNHKDQCLFLQGFKMGFSPAFLSQMMGRSSSKGEEGGGYDSGSSDEGDRKNGGGNSSRDSGHHSRGARGGGFASKPGGREGPSDSDEVLIESFPKNQMGNELHPCDRINRQLLHRTNAHIAVSHDDDWRFALENASPEGVAFLASSVPSEVPSAHSQPADSQVQDSLEEPCTEGRSGSVWCPHQSSDVLEQPLNASNDGQRRVDASLSSFFYCNDGISISSAEDPDTCGSYHANIASCLNNLEQPSLGCFDHPETLSNITQEAISVHHKAVELTPFGHPNLPLHFSNLGNSYMSRFKHLESLSDIAEAISAHQKAVELTPTGHPNLPSHFNNLGNSYLSRFKHLGSLSDIAEAISAHQKAVELTPTGHPNLPSQFNNLGNSYLSHFKHLGSLSDIAEAISAHQKAVELTPTGHPNLPSQFNNLGNSYLSRFEHLGSLSNMAEAISAHQKAMELTPSGHDNLPSCFNNLRNSFRSSLDCMGNLSNIAEAISARQNALVPSSHNSDIGKLFSPFDRTGDASSSGRCITHNHHQLAEALRFSPQVKRTPLAEPPLLNLSQCLCTWAQEPQKSRRIVEGWIRPGDESILSAESRSFTKAHITGARDLDLDEFMRNAVYSGMLASLWSTCLPLYKELLSQVLPTTPLNTYRGIFEVDGGKELLAEAMRLLRGCGRNAVDRFALYVDNSSTRTRYLYKGRRIYQELPACPGGAICFRFEGVREVVRVGTTFTYNSLPHGAYPPLSREHLHPPYSRGLAPFSQGGLERHSNSAPSELAPACQPVPPETLGSIGDTFLHRFERMSDLPEIAEAVSATHNQKSGIGEARIRFYAVYTDAHTLISQINLQRRAAGISLSHDGYSNNNAFRKMFALLVIFWILTSPLAQKPFPSSR